MSPTCKEFPPTPLFDGLDRLKSHIFKLDSVEIETAEKEYLLARDFLYSYRGSPATFNAYRREVERLLHWSWRQKKKSVLHLNRSDIEEFVEFCQHPPLSWIGKKNVPRFVEDEFAQRIPNSEWRPFVISISKVAYRSGVIADPHQYVLSQKALQAIFSILGSFYSYLIEEGAAQFNPVAQIRQKSKFIRKQGHVPLIRRLGELQWEYVIETAMQMAKQDPTNHERTLFIVSILFGMYLRISELAASKRWQPNMGHFYRDADGNWWFVTVGKGNKERHITVSDAMLSALARYRKSRGLTEFPSVGEITPLITQLKSNLPITSTRQIRTIVQKCFDRSVQRMLEDGFTQEADELRVATVHWLRHTGISEDVKVRPREHVRDDAGHSSSAITDKYIDVEKRARHASARKKKIIPDEVN